MRCSLRRSPTPGHHPTCVLPNKRLRAWLPKCQLSAPIACLHFPTADWANNPRGPCAEGKKISIDIGPATTQNLVVKLDGEICGGVLVENASDDFPQQKKLENLLPNFAGSSPPISPKTSPTSLWNLWCLLIDWFDREPKTQRKRI